MAPSLDRGDSLFNLPTLLISAGWTPWRQKLHMAIGQALDRFGGGIEIFYPANL
jgi:hypothetical protein